MSKQPMVQIPIPRSLKIKVEEVAKSYGSSLDETIKQLLTKYIKREIVVDDAQIEYAKLSSRAKKRYAKMDKDFKSGKNIQTAKDIDEFFKQLQS